MEQYHHEGSPTKADLVRRTENGRGCGQKIATCRVEDNWRHLAELRGTAWTGTRSRARRCHPRASPRSRWGCEGAVDASCIVGGKTRLQRVGDAPRPMKSTET